MLTLHLTFNSLTLINYGIHLDHWITHQWFNIPHENPKQIPTLPHKSEHFPINPNNVQHIPINI